MHHFRFGCPGWVTLGKALTEVSRCQRGGYSNVVGCLTALNIDHFFVERDTQLVMQKDSIVPSIHVCTLYIYITIAGVDGVHTRVHGHCGIVTASWWQFCTA